MFNLYFFCYFLNTLINIFQFYLRLAELDTFANSIIKYLIDNEGIYLGIGYYLFLIFISDLMDAALATTSLWHLEYTENN